MPNTGPIPQSPMPNVLSGMSTLPNMMMMRSASAAAQGNGQLPGTHPSNFILGHSQSNNQSHAQVVGSGGLFNSPMPTQPVPPSTPPYTHMQTKDSPYYNGLNVGNPLAIPKFNVMAMGGLEPITSSLQPMQKKIIASGGGGGGQSSQQINNATLTMMNNSINNKVNVIVSPLKISQAQQATVVVDEGNLSPKSQCGSDDEDETGIDAVKSE